MQCSASDPTACTTNSGKFCANLNTNPNFCGSCNKTCPSDTNNRCGAEARELGVARSAPKGCGLRASQSQTLVAAP